MDVEQLKEVVHEGRIATDRLADLLVSALHALDAAKRRIQARSPEAHEQHCRAFPKVEALLPDFIKVYALAGLVLKQLIFSRCLVVSSPSTCRPFAPSVNPITHPIPTRTIQRINQ